MSLLAVILLAGRGERMRPFSDTLHKSLLPVAGKPLLWHSIINLIDIGVEKFCFVIGHQAQQLEKQIENHFPALLKQFIYNPEYATTNNISSFALARHAISGQNFFRLEGDLFYSKTILKHLLKSSHSVTVAVHGKPKQSNEEFSVSVNTDQHTIRQFGKDIPAEDAFGEAKGIEFIREKASLLVTEALEQKIRADSMDEFSEGAYQYLIDHQLLPIHYHMLKKNDWWYEIDTPEDYETIQKNSRRHRSI